MSRLNMKYSIQKIMEKMKELVKHDSLSFSLVAPYSPFGFEVLQEVNFQFVQTHTVNFCIGMGQAKHVSGKNIFCSMNEEKIREERFFKLHIVLSRAELNCTIYASRMGRSAGANQVATRKANVRKIPFPLVLYTFIEQNTFFPETCFADTIFKQRFKVCLVYQSVLT